MPFSTTFGNGTRTIYQDSIEAAVASVDIKRYQNDREFQKDILKRAVMIQRAVDEGEEVMESLKAVSQAEYFEVEGFKYDSDKNIVTFSIVGDNAADIAIDSDKKTISPDNASVCSDIDADFQLADEGVNSTEEQETASSDFEGKHAAKHASISKQATSCEDTEISFEENASAEEDIETATVYSLFLPDPCSILGALVAEKATHIGSRRTIAIAFANTLTNVSEETAALLDGKIVWID